MVNSIITTSACVVFPDYGPPQAFTSGTIVQPSSIYFHPLLATGFATDSGLPAVPGPVISPTYAVVVDVTGVGAGWMLKWDATLGRFIVYDIMGDIAATYAPKLGPTFGGTVTVPTPTVDQASANKGYVDAQVTAAQAFSGKITASTTKVVNNSAAPSADTDLTVALVANGVYQIDYFLEFDLATGGGTGTDLLVSLDTSAIPGAAGLWSSAFDWDAPTGAAAAARGPLAALSTNLIFALSDAVVSGVGTRGVQFRIKIVNGTTAGNLVVKWAQNVAAAFDLTRLAYPRIRWERYV